uniref:ATP synthase F0 subunit 8 n=1 Tax=Scaphoideus varius TaxID=2021109 RepID=A0A343ETE4_9HEMI|nr:ATP synthase F0 subunit 8 [Scaphoideus varius]
MPQMAPMWWTLIMMFTFIMLMMTIIINYFNSNKIIKKTLSTKSLKMNWMW